MPAIVSKLKFIDKNSKEKYSGYINYKNRDKAIKKDQVKEKLSLYNHYMGNPKKSTGIFTDFSDGLTEKELEHIKSLFDLAQEKDSLMWQDVFSFDNKWLEEQGLYNSDTKRLDEQKIKESIRKSINYTTEKLDIKESSIWSAAIHYNTKNIHVHVAICEPVPTQERGFISDKIRKTMKSKVINHLIDFDKEYKEINKLLRDDLVKSARNFDISKDIEMKRLIQEVIKNLPSDSRHWHYNYNTMKDSNKHLDKLTKYYIKNYKFDEYKELINKLDKQELKFKELYGVGKKQNFKKYKKNKIDELYTRMGNAFLGDLKDILKEEKEKSNKKYSLKSNLHEKLIINNYNSKSNKIVLSKKHLNKIGNALGSELDNYKNQSKYMQLQREIELNM